MILLPLLIAFAASAPASDDKIDRATLRGIKTVCTIVELTGPTQAGIPISKENLKAGVDGRLLAAGIVLDKNAPTCLYLNLRPLPAMGRNNKPIGLYALDVNLQFLQTVSLTRDPSIKAYPPTWSVSNLATVPADDLEPTARQIAMDLTDQFLEAFRSANPK